MDDLQLGINNTNSEGKADVKKMNFLQRLLGVIFSPGVTMENIIAKPRALLPIILIAVAPVLIYLTRLSLYIDETKAVAEKTAQRMSEFYIENGMKVSPEQLSSSTMTKPVLILVSLAASALFAWFIGTVILFALIKIFKGEGMFKQVLSISGHAYAILILEMLIIVGVSFITGSIKLDLSLGVFSGQLLSGTQGTFYFGFMYKLLTGFKIFTIWNLAVVGMGITRLTGLSKTKVCIMLGLIFIVPVIFGAVSGGFTEAMMGLISATV